MTTAVQPKPYHPLANQGGTVAKSQQTAIEQSRAVAEVQAQVIVAQNCPRDINRAVAEMRESCGLLPMAQQAFYQVPNRGNGPSVHLLRELARIWGNVQHGTHELARDDSKGESEIQAWAWDVQTNTRTSRTFVVPHARMKAKERQLLTDLGDIQNNNNNVGARAVRECISNVLPRWFTEEAQNICRGTLEHGEGKPLPDRIADMLAAFKGLGIVESQIETKLSKKRGQWDAGDVAQLGIAYTSITRDGYDRNEMFPPAAGVTVEQIGGGRRSRAPKAAEPEPDRVHVDVSHDNGPPGGQSPPAPDHNKVLRRMHVLFGKADIAKDNRADRLTVTRAIVGRIDPPIESSNDLTTEEAEQLVVQLSAWDDAGDLGAQVTEILNAATLTEVETN